MPIRDTTGLAIAKVMCRQEVILEGLKVRAIGGGRFAGTPQLGELELRVEVLQIGGARAQIGDADVSAVDET